MVDYDDWQIVHRNAAACQGWCISEVDDAIDQWQVQRLDDADITGNAWGVDIPRLESDADAAAAMKAAFLRGEDHAILAWKIIRNVCHQEFTHWDMQSWTTSSAKVDAINTWFVIGGVFTDDTWTTMESGTGECHGPFQDEITAEQARDGLSRRNIDIFWHKLWVVQR